MGVADDAGYDPSEKDAKMAVRIMDAFEKDFLRLRPTLMKWVRLALFGKTLQVTGMDNLPMQGPAVIVGNHIGSYKDIAALLEIIPRQIHFTANQEIFSRERFHALIRAHFKRHLKEFGLLFDVAIRPIKVPFVNFISDNIGRVGTIPVDLMEGKTKALQTCEDFLLEGRAVVLLQGRGRINPRDSHPFVCEFRRGPAVICAKIFRDRGLVVPLIPIAMYGTHMPWVVPGKIKIGIGQPMKVSDYATDDLSLTISRFRAAMEKRTRRLLYRLVKGG
ncbi:MAG: lysophospholipid acyltransferase family protein [Candidatus Aminicenantaceae bacterium]